MINISLKNIESEKEYENELERCVKCIILYV